MENGVTPILDSVVKSQSWNPFNPHNRELFADREKREMDHLEWLDSIIGKVNQQKKSAKSKSAK